MLGFVSEDGLVFDIEATHFSHRTASCARDSMNLNKENKQIHVRRREAKRHTPPK